jgi:hypothetical protein
MERKVVIAFTLDVGSAKSFISQTHTHTHTHAHTHTHTHTHQASTQAGDLSFPVPDGKRNIHLCQVAKNKQTKDNASGETEGKEQREGRCEWVGARTVITQERDVTNTREKVPAEMLLLQIYPSGGWDELKFHCDI